MSLETRIQIRRDSAANWTSNNPILALGELGFDTTNNVIRVGNGVDRWNDLEVLGAGPASGVSYDNSTSGLSAVNVQVAIDVLSGTKATYYEHEQQVASNEWTITHNLGKMPSVTVIDSADTIVIGDTEFLSNNQLKISFTGAFTGRAYLV